MWICPNCQNQIEDRYAHCWNCGMKRAPVSSPVMPRSEATSVPHFSSIEEMAPVPKSQSVFFSTGPLARIFGRLLGLVVLGVLFIIAKILASDFMSKYGLYIMIAVAVTILAVILWRFFHRDSSEGVGIKLE
jgi:predicted amidophosphoribosyltransferase